MNNLNNLSRIIKLQSSDLNEETLSEIIKVWEKSVRATHHFLTEEDILFFRTMLREKYLLRAELYIVRSPFTGGITGFMGLSEDRLEMLFLHPEAIGKGLGKEMLQYAVERCGIQKVDVNEQNKNALQFYERYGFTVYSKDEADATGKPFPIFHLQLRPEPEQREKQ